MRPFIELLREATNKAKQSHPNITFKEAKSLPEIGEQTADIAQWRFIFQDMKQLIVLYYTEGKFSRPIPVSLA